MIDADSVGMNTRRCKFELIWLINRREGVREQLEIEKTTVKACGELLRDELWQYERLLLSGTIQPNNVVLIRSF